MKVFVLFCPHCRSRTITKPPEDKVWADKIWAGKEKTVKCNMCGARLDATQGTRRTLRGKRPVNRIDLLEVR